MEILYLILGLFIGALTVYFIFQQKFKAGNDISVIQIKNLKEELENRNKTIEEKNQQLIELNRELAKSKTELLNFQEKLLLQKKEIDDLHQRFTIEFKNLANEILEEKSKKFTEQNKENLNQILNPLNEKIKEFHKKVEETYDKEAQQRFSLKEEVKRLAELNQQISKEAKNLTHALKGDSKTQGNWGEVILENILDRSGLVKDREYFIQQSFTNEEGKRLQPDIVVKYPGERNIIIDSKVSLTAYERYVNAESEEEKNHELKLHIDSIKNHISILNSKNYQDLYRISGIDFVIMFLPIEPAYLLAIQNDPEIWNYAYERKILLISPTNLIAALKMIVSMWRQEYQNKNALEIARQGGELYDKFVGLLEDMKDIRNKLQQTQRSFDNAMNKISEGKGNLIKKAEDIKELGIKTKKTIPQDLTD